MQPSPRGDGIDWAGAESLAFASLATEGIPVRLSGQDCARGTFSQRHSVLADIKSGRSYTPLNHLAEDQAPFQVFNSLLAEFSVLGFEFGYAAARPDGLIMWEAQFGDFANNAQAIIDLYIASGESKWQRLNGLVLLLPHGYEGLGPEHSSARLERFLQLCAEDNLQVCAPTTPAQYFHLLRRQAKQRLRKPLVVMTPKSLLRHPQAVSKLTRLATGGFEEILVDPLKTVKPQRLIFCSGKIYYDLEQRRRERDTQDTAIVRLEQLYPFPARQLEKLMPALAPTVDCCWVQEEPANMGAWCFVRPLLEDLLQQPLTYIGRPAAASTATGFPQIHKRQQAAIVDGAIGSPA